VSIVKNRDGYEDSDDEDVREDQTACVERKEKEKRS
jgi:hypothetical protein